MRYRETPRLKVATGIGFIGVGEHVDGAPGDGFPTLIGLYLGVGFRENLSQKVGLELRANAIIGEASVSNRVETNVDSTRGRDVFVDASLYFNPFWRAYLGPTLTLGYHWFDRASLIDAQYTYDLNKRGPFHGGIAVQGGILFLKREQLDFSMRLGLDLPGLFPMVVASVGFHFLVDEE